MGFGPFSSDSNTNQTTEQTTQTSSGFGSRALRSGNKSSTALDGGNVITLAKGSTFNLTTDNQNVGNAFTALSGALGDAIKNRDVISTSPAGNTTVTPLSGAEPAGGWAGVLEFMNSGTARIALVVLFAALGLAMVFRKKKTA